MKWKKKNKMSSMKYNLLQFKTSMKAWEGLNRLFLFNDTDIEVERKGKAQYINDLVVYIENPMVDPDFDFGRHFNYTKSKWKSLVSNYIDPDSLCRLRIDTAVALEANKMFNFGYQFDNKHAHGKNCLLSMAVSIKAGIDNPIITVFMRASEVTKRLICDLLLIQRIGEYLLQGRRFSICIHFNQIFNDDTVLLMYHAHEDIHRIIKPLKDKNIKVWKELTSRLEHLLSCEPDSIKYKVHKRALKVLRPELFKYPKTLAKDCTLGNEDWLPF